MKKRVRLRRKIAPMLGRAGLLDRYPQGWLRLASWKNAHYFNSSRMPLCRGVILYDILLERAAINAVDAFDDAGGNCDSCRRLLRRRLVT
jgi:hypothetical protein